MSASTSCKSLLAGIRRGEFPPEALLRELGETRAGEFFREIVEPLADSFDSTQAAAYERLMRTWIPASPRGVPVIPARVETVYVLSRVTLGADIKIVSPILAAMKRRFRDARVVFVANRKSAELFAADPRIEPLIADYPRSGTVSDRLRFAEELHSRLDGANSIVVDPDSRMTQLGLLPVCRPENYFHFPSRTAGGDGLGNLSDLVSRWLEDTFGVSGSGYIAPRLESVPGARPLAAVSLGVGENESKRIGGDFETRLIRALGDHFENVWLDRGIGGGEAVRVTAAVEKSGVAGRVHFWDGSFAGFAAIIAQSDFYTGYDSAGQHVAAAAGVPLVSIFAGAPAERFRLRWSASGPGPILRIDADDVTPDSILKELATRIRLDWKKRVP